LPPPAGQPEGPPQRVHLGLSRLSARRRCVQPHAGRPRLAGEPLAGRANRGLAGALSGLPAGAAGWPSGGAVPAVSGVCDAQSAALARARAAWAGAMPGTVVSLRLRPQWVGSRLDGRVAAWARVGRIRRLPTAMRRLGRRPHAIPAADRTVTVRYGRRI